jgi:hypothetical protein
MFEKYDKIKEKLNEISGTLNTFKSEAVQLRIIDYLLGSVVPPEEEEIKGKKRHNKRLTKSKGKELDGNPKSPKTKNTGGTGAYSMINRLLKDDFFKSSKTINQMIKHLDLNYAKKIKANDISGKLVRLVRDGELTRVKNKENQYEYKKP